jgi:hypothetical protein
MWRLMAVDISGAAASSATNEALNEVLMMARDLIFTVSFLLTSLAPGLAGS